MGVSLCRVVNWRCVFVIVGQRRIEGATIETPGGRPLPLTGRPLTDTPVVAKKAGVPLRAYPEVCVPSEEPLADRKSVV